MRLTQGSSANISDLPSATEAISADTTEQWMKRMRQTQTVGAGALAVPCLPALKSRRKEGSPNRLVSGLTIECLGQDYEH